MTLSVTSTAVVNGDRSITLGTATPGSPATGMIRYNSSSALFEVYNGTAWTGIIIASPSSSPLWRWGGNGSGRIGDNTTANRSSPVSVVGGFSDWVEVSGSHGVRANGTLWGWGYNTFGGAGGGQVGDGTRTNRSSPVSVVGGFTDWIKVADSGMHCLGLRMNGTLWAWGYGSYGRLGNGATSNRSSPVSVVGGFTDWKQIAVGGNHSLGLRTDGSIWAWGYNGQGQLGNNANTPSANASPISVVGGFLNWTQISAGVNHSASLRSVGTIWCWGNNTYGQLGNNAGLNQLSPVSVVGGFTDWVQVSAGGFNTGGIRSNGSLWMWGRNNYGQLGNNTATNTSSPVSVVGGFTDWADLNASSTVNAIRANGVAYSWGRNDFGQIGNNNTASTSSPVSVVGGFTDWVQIGYSSGLRAI